jgi:hypothetical protein
MFAAGMRSEKARVRLSVSIAEEITAGDDKIDEEGSLRDLFGRLRLRRPPALRLPFMRGVDRHFRDDEARAWPDVSLGLHQVIEVVNAFGRPGDANPESPLDQPRTNLIERLLIRPALVVFGEQDHFLHGDWQFDGGEAACSERRPARISGRLDRCRRRLGAFAQKQRHAVCGLR